MPTFIMLTERPSTSMPKSQSAQRRLGQETRKARWWLQYPTYGESWRSVDIFEAPNLASALLISTRISEISGCRTELWPVACAFEAANSAIPIEAQWLAAKPATAIEGALTLLRGWARRWTRHRVKPGLESIGQA